MLATLSDYFFQTEDICLFANAQEKTFGLSGLRSALVWKMLEMRSGIQLDFTDWLSLVIPGI